MRPGVKYPLVALLPPLAALSMLATTQLIDEVFFHPLDEVDPDLDTAGHFSVASVAPTLYLVFFYLSFLYVLPLTAIARTLGLGGFSAAVVAAAPLTIYVAYIFYSPVPGPDSLAGAIFAATVMAALPIMASSIIISLLLFPRPAEVNFKQEESADAL